MLRISAGQFKGKLLALPPQSLTRPSSDRLRQAVFNILVNHINFNSIRVLDAFAGSGAFGLEAISRGAVHVIFCEKETLVSKVLQKNISDTLKTNTNKATLHSDLFNLQSCSTVDLVFIDPPYDQSLEIKAIEHLCKYRLLASNAIVVIEQRKNSPIIANDKFTTILFRIYGNCQVTILMLQ